MGMGMLYLHASIRHHLLSLIEIHTVAPRRLVLDHIKIIRREPKGPQNAIPKLQHISVHPHRALEKDTQPTSFNFPIISPISLSFAALIRAGNSANAFCTVFLSCSGSVATVANSL